MNNTAFLAGLASCLASAALGQTQLIVNGGFESQNGGEWVISGLGAGIRDSTTAAHSGMGYLAFSGAGGGSAQAAYQTITVPTNTVAAELSYYYNVYSPTLNSGDSFMAAVVYPDTQAVAAQVDSETGANSSGGQGPAYYLLKTFDLTPWAGQTIEIGFAATFSSGGTVFNIDDVSVLVETTADIPPNDYFTNRIALAGTSTNVQANNTFATKEPGEPNHAGNPGGQSLWWSWTATANGILRLNTTGTSFPDLLAVYTGDSVTNLTRVASNAADIPSGTLAQLQCKVSAGTQYQIAVDGYTGYYGIVELALSFSADTQPPTVSISYPAPNAKLTNSTVVVQGTASDNIAVAAVEYRLENAAGTNDYQTATGTNRWSATIPNLAPGLNTVRVFAIDTSSNLSGTVARTFTYAVVEPLVVTVQGSGTLTPKYNGADLVLGQAYTITAAPASGCIFVNWTDNTGRVLATTLKLSFTMTTGLQLQANFIPNPFIPLKGTYAGLFADTNGFASANAGSFSATLTTQGGLTAQLLLAGATYRLSGSLSASGAYSNTIAGPAHASLKVQLQLDLQGGGQGLTGTVAGPAWSADLAACRAPYSQANPAPEAGRKYTLVMPGAAEPSAGPGGYGFGTLSVTPVGNVSLSLTLGDGTKLTQNSVVVNQGQSPDQWPLYLAPYSGKGLVTGWLSFVTNNLEQDVVGQLRWVKQPGAAGKLYPNGFVFANGVEILESLYAYTNGKPVLSWSQGVLELAGGNLSSGLTNPVTLGANNKLSGTNKLSLTLTTATGLFQGTVPVPGLETLFRSAACCSRAATPGSASSWVPPRAAASGWGRNQSTVQSPSTLRSRATAEDGQSTVSPSRAAPSGWGRNRQGGRKPRNTGIHGKHQFPSSFPSFPLFPSVSFRASVARWPAMPN